MSRLHWGFQLYETYSDCCLILRGSISAQVHLGCSCLSYPCVAFNMVKSCLVQTKAKYLFARPRLRKKSMCDHHRRPVSQVDIATVNECCPSPVVVSQVSYPEIRSVVTLEQEFGQLLRSTPEYRGLGMTSLRSILSKRVAIHLDTVKWVPDPILVSEKVLRSWLDQYEIPARADDIKAVAQHRKSIGTSAELED